MNLCAPCLFGLEKPLSDELKKLGLANVRAEDGRVLFSGDIEQIALTNLWLRTAERVMIVVGDFTAKSFPELFDGVNSIPWEDYLPNDAAFPVRGHCVSSALMSVPDCRSIIKRAVADRLSSKYGYSRAPETGAKYQLRFTIIRDRVLLHIDTTGTALHKRGYRALSNEAPLRETLAAGMLLLARYRGRPPFVDPFCGSGTIAIEAALLAKNRAPGLFRHFDFENWPHGFAQLSKLRAEAPQREFNGLYDIMGKDIDPSCVSLAEANAAKAGVSQLIRFECGDVRELKLEKSDGLIVTNPPYGVRMGEAADAESLIHSLGESVSSADRWSCYILSADAEIEQSFGRHADSRRKLYNGMLKCDMYKFVPQNTKKAD